jgi:D-arginine utilization repressor
MTNWDGKKFKCVSITIRRDDGHPIGIACFHFDTTIFRNINGDLLHLISTNSRGSTSPIEQFTDDWRERVNECIDNYLKENNVTLEILSSKQKRQAINKLYSHGLFNYRKAAMYIGKRLGLSRA